MGGYQTFLDGAALGFFLGFIAFYLLHRYIAPGGRNRKPRSTASSTTSRTTTGTSPTPRARTTTEPRARPAVYSQI